LPPHLSNLHPHADANEGAFGSARDKARVQAEHAVVQWEESVRWMCCLLTQMLRTALNERSCWLCGARRMNGFGLCGCSRSKTASLNLTGKDL